MKLFFRFSKGCPFMYFDVLSIWPNRARNGIYLTSLVEADEDGAASIKFEDIEHFSCGAEAERDAESAIRALLPKAESKEIKAVLSATYEGGSTECYPLTDYHVEFHTGEVSPKSPEPIRLCSTCPHRVVGASGYIYCHHPLHVGHENPLTDDIPCDDWEAKP